MTFRKEFMGRLPAGTKFYHPLPRHRVHPTIPTFLDDTPLNGWERQSINGMYVRIVLLALVAGRIGSDFAGDAQHAVRNDEEYIIRVEQEKKDDQHTKEDAYSEGVRPIRDGLVIDHICKGDDPATIRAHGPDHQGDGISTREKAASAVSTSKREEACTRDHLPPGTRSSIARNSSGSPRSRPGAR